MEEIKVKVENVFDFFSDDHEIADYFVNAVKNGEVKNFRYIVCKDGDCNFSFERNNKKYVMDPEMSPEFAMEIIEEFQRAAFKYIHKKPEKLNSIIEKFKNDRTLEEEFHLNRYSMYDYYSTYDVETKFFIEKGLAGKYIDYSYLDFNNVDEEDVTNTFVFAWCHDAYCPCSHEESPDIDKIIKKYGGVKFYVDYNDYDFEGNLIEISKRFYMYMNNLVEVQLPKIRKIVTETYFEEK